MSTFKEFITKFGFEVDKEPLDKVEHSLEQIKNRLEFLAAAEIVKGIAELAEKFAHFAEELHVAAVSSGLTVEAFQKLAFAAGQSAVSQEELGGAMARLGRHLYEARMGSEEAQKAFQQAGFTSEQVRGFHTAGDAMAALADRFKGIQDPIQKQALAMQLMGRGSVNMVGFLSQGSAAIRGLGDEAEKLGIILSGEQVEALVKVEHSLNELWAIFKALGATIASYFAPSIETAIHDFIKFYEVNKKLIDTNVRAWVWDITFALGFVWQAVKYVTQGFFDFAKTHETLVRRVMELALALGFLVGVIWSVQKVFTVTKGAIDLVGNAFGLLKMAFMPVVNLLKAILIPVFEALQAAFAYVLEEGGLLIAEMFPALGEAIAAFGVILEATPVGWFIAGLAALAVAIHDVWVLLSGGSWSDTWLSKAFEAVKGLGSKALSFLGLNGNDQESTNNAAASLTAANNLSSVGSVGRGGPSSSFAAGQAAAGGNSSYEVNAPITIQVPAGTDHKMIGEKLKEGISDHLDKVYRRAQQSLRPAQSY